jgi:hypothetical protein
MKRVLLFFIGTLILSLFSCVPVEKIAFHDFSPGYYKLKTPNTENSGVYVDIIEDTIVVYPAIGNKKNLSDDTSSFRRAIISNIVEGNELYGSCFIKKSADIDLSTVLLKYRPSMGDVPNQLNANLNAALYVGYRKDFYKMVTTTSPLKKKSTSCRHTGYDFGLFAGIGITQINPSVTANKVDLEYDGIIFQKGIGLFVTFGRSSVGMVLGFDNLMDKNKNFWLFNQKPYLGLSIGIANF